MKGDQQQLGKLERYIRSQIGEDSVPDQDQLNILTGQTEYLSYFIWQCHRSPETLFPSVKANRCIPSNITYDHLIQTMRHWRAFGAVPARQRPQKYAVRFHDVLYPVKLLIARANTFANGTLLDINHFSGGVKAANRFVEQRGLSVVSLES